MQYRLISENEAEKDALKNNPVAKTLLDPFIPLVQAKALICAVKAGLFEILGEKELTITSISQRLEIKESKLSQLLNLLIVTGYLTKRENGFGLTDLANFTLKEDSPASLSNWIKFCDIQWDMISQMENSLFKEQRMEVEKYLSSEHDWAVHQRAMLETSMSVAPRLGELIQVKEGAEKMLDIGGGHGFYGAMICKNNLPLKSVVLDSKNAVCQARKISEEYKYSEFVEYLEGDILVNEIGEKIYDLIFLGNLVHHFSAEQLRKVFAKCNKGLKPGGSIAIWDFVEMVSRQEFDSVYHCFSLFFAVTSQAGCYSGADLKLLLQEAGFEQIEIYQHVSPMHTLLLAKNS